ncbi:hypothetical protein REJC140_01456 [Pseudorhizobium endolithicum]|uniref:Dihydrodipicolinate reductase n=1 Tax=Pseudorhizobium endolithicum TaxID=1191678 RepID=A0ABN7JUR0_9HYPH|nr:DUF1674 domain-containing protein [Pseudorhizobium endolithicum]CAD6429864.1 hypothetical protein REQ54_03371 [Rhizobium sp. Q54]CAD7049042.1 hypothetical protein REJC140_01456 [Pseudorhizobium endolithicum]
MQTPDNDNTTPPSAEMTPGKPLSAAAKRALEEAEQRRQAEKQQEMPAEIGGRGGADPARFGDWEINGRAIDF